MSLIRIEDRKKWTNAFVVLVSVLTGFLVISATMQLGEWLDLEAKVKHLLMTVQGLGIVAGVCAFFIIQKNKKSSSYLQECYMELVKVVWPDRSSVVKSTFVILIGVSLISLVFLGMDVVFRKLLEWIY